MKIRTILYLTVMLFLSACQNKQTFKLPEGTPSNGQRLAIASYNKHYLTDFVVESAGEKIPFKKYFRTIQDSKQKDANELSETYLNAKTTLINLGDASNTEEGKNALIQIIALPYMRNYLLPQRTEESKKELAELLTLVMPTNPIDLDVLVDAYIAGKKYLTQDQQMSYFDYFVQLYSRQKEEVKPGFIQAKKRYEASQTDDEKYSAIIAGKRFERLSESLSYSNDRLNLKRFVN